MKKRRKKKYEILATGEKIDGVQSRNQLTEFLSRSLASISPSFSFGVALILFSDTVGCTEQERKKRCLQARCISVLLNKSGAEANKVLLKILQSKK